MIDLSPETLARIRAEAQKAGTALFDQPLITHDLPTRHVAGFLSIDTDIGPMLVKVYAQTPGEYHRHVTRLAGIANCDPATVTALIDALTEARGEVERATGRLCVNCGRVFPAEYDRSQEPADCPARPACTIDMTTEEAFNHFRQIAHDQRGRITALEAEKSRLREALAWYGEQSRLARLIHSEGDAGRAALAADGGTRARALTGGPNDPK